MTKDTWLNDRIMNAAQKLICRQNRQLPVSSQLTKEIKLHTQNS